MDLRARFGIGALSTCLLLAAAGVAVARGSGEAEAGRAGLPELPPSAEADPDRYDADGCLRVDQGVVDCEASAAELDRARLGAGAGDMRHLAGFSGTHWTGDLSANRVKVLESTISVATDEGFVARGLARNETGSTVAAVSITAALEDHDGGPLSAVQVTSPVGPVRPGEPVPFEVHADVPSGDVAHVRWSAQAGGVAPTGPRTAEWQPYYELPGGDRDRIELYLHSDPVAGPLPHVLYGSVGNVGLAPLDQPRLTAAFLDDGGRVVAIGETPLAGPNGAPTARLAPDAEADALVAVSPVGAPGGSLVWIVAQG